MITRPEEVQVNRENETRRLNYACRGGSWSKRDHLFIYVILFGG